MRIGLNRNSLKLYAVIVAVAGSGASPRALAGVKFACFEAPGRPAQVFEYANGSCGSSDKNRNALNIRQQQGGSHDVLCMYTAFCMPQEPEVKRAKNLSREELDDMFHTGELKESVLVCQGKAQYADRSQLTKPDCPDVSLCRKDVFYNLSRYAPMVVPSEKIRSLLTPQNDDGAR